MKPFIYAETAFHHQGDMDFMIGLIEAASRAGADGVKFQVLLDYDDFISTKHAGYEGFKIALFSKEEWAEIFEFCASKKLKIIFMPCDLVGLELIKSGYSKPDFLDLHSVSFYDEAVLHAIKKSKLPLILGIGGRTGDEVAEKYRYFGDQIHCLMVGFQSFPTDLKDVRIEKIAQLKELYPGQQIGYADHSKFDHADAIDSNLIAQNLGATIFEKHLTTLEGEERFDWVAAIGEAKFKTLVQELHQNLGNAVLTKAKVDLNQLSEPEIVYRNRQKFAVAAKDLKPGEKLSKENVRFKMTDSEEGFAKLEEILDCELQGALEEDQTIQQKHLN